MSEWWTYSLSDFLLFSPRTYYRLFELYNEAVWPAHIAAAACAVAIALLIRRGDTRGANVILAAAWLWIAIAFHLDRYAAINWAATYIAALFALQAALLLWTGTIRGKLTVAPNAVGVALFAFAVLLQPALGAVAGRSWTQAEIFGLAPDPTAVATLGILLMTRRTPWHLLVIPLLWCAFTGLTLWAMETPDAWVPPAAAALALAAALWKSLGASRAAS